MEKEMGVDSYDLLISLAKRMPSEESRNYCGIGVSVLGREESMKHLFQLRKHLFPI
jgi:hypothetical protein